MVGTSLIRRGVTLVELLVVVAVIAALIVMILPAVQGAREAGRRTVCGNNLREIGCGVYGHETAQAVFPVGCLGCVGPPFPLRQISWNVFLLPYIEQSTAAAAFDTHFAYRSTENRAAAGVVIPLFLCPSTSRTARKGPTTGDRNGNGQWNPGDDLAYTDYGGMFGVGYPVPKPSPSHLGVMVYERATSAADITDGLSKTVLVAECTGRGATYQSEWANGQNLFDQWHTNPINRSQNNEIWSDHPGMAGMVFCDGHVEFIRESIDQAVLLALLTRAAGDGHGN